MPATTPMPAPTDTLTPSPAPTAAPTSASTATPTPAPTAAPTAAPTPATAAPTPAPTAAPTPTPAPTAAPTPPPTAPPALVGGGLNSLSNPSANGYPDGTNSGYRRTGVTLRVYAGPNTITTPNITLDSYHFTSGIVIATTGVKITRSWFDLAPGSTDTAIDTDHGTCGCNPGNIGGLAVSDTEFSGGFYGLRGNWSTGDESLLRVYMHDLASDYVSTSFGKTLIQDSYLGSPAWASSTAGHVQLLRTETAPANSIAIRHSTLNAAHSRTGTDANAAISIICDFGSGGVATFEVRDSLLDGGHYTIQATLSAGGAVGNEIMATNRFGAAAQYGPTAIDVAGAQTVTGNVYDATGLPVT